MSKKKKYPKQIKPMPTAQVTLYSEINDAIEVMGKQALEIAVYDMHYLHPVVLVITQNFTQPGHMADIVIQAKTTDKRGRERRAMNNGPAEKLFVQWTTNAVNLLRGLSRQEMAELCGLTKYDMRLDWYCKTISKVCRKVLHLEVGWYKGRFRVMTAKQVRAKETGLVKRNVVGGAGRADDRLKIETGKKYKPTGQVQVQALLFENEAAAEANTVDEAREASD